jgi:molybdopterin synthase sulfur carrier subunit
MAEETIRILYFAWLRDRIGMAEETAALPAAVATVGALKAWLCRRDPAHAAAFAAGQAVRCAVNQVFAADAAAVRPGDEVAFFPPVTGG